jgi:stage III sporulation protein AE
METADIITEQNDLIEYDEIQSVINSNFDNGDDFDFFAIVSDLMDGQYDYEDTSIVSIVVKELFKDLKVNIKILLDILLISVLFSFIKNMSNFSTNRQICETSNIIVSFLIISLVIQSYNLLNNMAVDIVESLISFIEVLIPSLMSVIVLSGATISSVVIGESLLTAIYIVNNIILNVLLPFLYIILMIVMLNLLTDEEYFGKAIQLLKNGYAWILKIILVVFIFFFSLQSFGVPVVDGVMTKTVRQTINIIPVVGASLAEASNVVMGCGSILKNAFGIGAIIAIVLLTFVPVIKILALGIIYKVSSAVIEPICEAKLVNCLSYIADVCFLLLGTVLVTVFMFIIAITITLFLTNILLYIQ